MSSQPLIQPRTLKGFRDYPPEAMIPRERLIDTARRVYRSYGFSPIDTPALEHLEILTGKGSDETDKQLYKFEDDGQRMVGMRFDLTVPLARFAAMYVGQLGTPFKRYHIATVWRGEKPQRGRFREFMQCDFDTIGTESAAADIETALVIHDLMSAIGFERFTIHVNNRLVLNGFLERLGLLEQSTAVLRALDKLAKIGREKVHAELREAAGVDEASANRLLDMAEMQGDNAQVLDQLQEFVGDNAIGQRGVAGLRALRAAMLAAGVQEPRLKVDPSIARGLDYYTGTIYETFLDDLPEIGSVCSGGRYDNLAGLFTKQHLPGVGASLGLDRLLAAMESLGMLEKISTPADVFIAWFVEDRLHDYLRIAADLRRAGLGVEFYPEAKKLGQQLKYADRRGFRTAVIIGEDEFAQGACQVKNLVSGESQTIALDDQSRAVAAAIQAALEKIGKADSVR